MTTSSTTAADGLTGITGAFADLVLVVLLVAFGAVVLRRALRRRASPAAR